MVATELLTKQLEAVTHNIEAIEILIAEYPFKNIDQRLRLRELQILYRGMAKCLDGAVKDVRVKSTTSRPGTNLTDEQYNKLRECYPVCLPRKGCTHHRTPALHH